MFPNVYFPQLYFDESYFSMESVLSRLFPTRFIVRVFNPLFARAMRSRTATESQEAIYQDSENITYSPTSTITVPIINRKVVVK
jgi:hypothetical protein